MSEPIELDIVGCARCDGDGHEGLVFEPLTHPVMQYGNVVYTHWAMCPTTSEPILLTFTDRA